ncbi:hypothetical protein BH10BAC3_BH10BAC3_41860 [soil metagenome]
MTIKQRIRLAQLPPEEQLRVLERMLLEKQLTVSQTSDNNQPPLASTSQQSEERTHLADRPYLKELGGEWDFSQAGQCSVISVPKRLTQEEKDAQRDLAQKGSAEATKFGQTNPEPGNAIVTDETAAVKDEHSDGKNDAIGSEETRNIAESQQAKVPLV